VPALDDTHRRAQRALQDRTGTAVAGLLAAITLERSQQIRDAYATANSRLIAGGQQSAARLALAYIAAYAPPTTPPDLVTALAGTLITPDSPGAFVGLLRLWSLLDQDVPEPQARQQAGSYSANLSGGDLQAAQRAGLDEAARAAGRRPRWRKDPSPTACAWCQTIASGGARYHSADSVPFHQSDHCSVSPEF